MIFLILVVIFNFNVHIFFYYCSSTVIIICNEGSHGDNITNVLVLTCHCICLLFIVHEKHDDGFVN